MRQTLQIFLLVVILPFISNAADSGAVFTFKTVGEVHPSGARAIQAQMEKTIKKIGYDVMTSSAVTTKIKSGKALVDLCQENDNVCYQKYADELDADNVFFGVIEKAGAKTALDLRLFVRGEKSTGKVSKSYLGFHEDGSELPIENMVDYVVGKVIGAFGYLKVLTNADGADIFLDGRKVGMTPVKKPLRVLKGDYKIEIKKTGYKPYRGEVEIEVEETSTKKGAMKPLPFSLTVSSEPRNAAVFLGETNVGYTPIKNHKILSFGRLPLKVTVEEHFDSIEEIDVVPGGSIKRQLKLKPKFGDVFIASKALDVKVYLDGNFVGSTPLKTLPKIEMGKHVIEMKSTDYLPFKKTVEISPNQLNRFNLDPTPKYAKLRVTSNVERARVYIGKKFIGFSPVDDFVRMSPGEYRIKVSKHTYFDFDDDIELSPGANLVVNANLNSQLGTLNLTSNIRKAKIYLDGSFVGTTPLKKPLENIKFGKHQLLLQKKPFFDYKETIVIKPGRENAHFAEMVTTLGKLKIESNVKGAQVFLGESFVTKTPSDVIEKVRPGKRTLRVTKEGYDPYEVAVDIVSNKVNTFTINLQRLSAWIEVTSEPKGAAVFIGGKKVGKTPGIFQRATGSHEVVVAAKGYRTYKTKISVAEGDKKKVVASLSPKPYQLYVYANEQGANVYVDRVLVGTTPVTGYRGSDFGVHTLTVTKTGYKTVKKRIRMRPGKRYKIDIKLKKVR